jgi:hypothetical protein
MPSILSVFKQEGLDCLPCDPLNLDLPRFDEYRDAAEHTADAIFESLPPQSDRRRISSRDLGCPILRFFLDGSRKTYKVADLILEGRYLPVIAGQVGVAVIARDQSLRLRPFREFCRLKNLIAFPDKTSDDDLTTISAAVNATCRVPFEMVKYTIKPEKDAVDLGVAKIMSEMQNLEIQIVQDMAEAGILQNDSMLVIDGPLRFRKNIDVQQFRNVVGLSKSFRPNFTVGKSKKRQDVGTITARLEFGERSSVFKTSESENIIGMWYLRIRQPEMMPNPLQGVIKLECFAFGPNETENGIDSNRVDCVSAHLMRERNVTPYQADFRWASHIYPVYMAETYLKASFLSDQFFRGLF